MKFSYAMLMAGVSALAFASNAVAQNAPAGGAVEEVVVTGSRIVSNGFNAPTPVTTVSAQALTEAAPSNIPDALNQLPQFSNSRSPQASSTWNASSPQQGNFLNLRGLGSTRSIILLDGVRVPPTSFDGAVDVNTLPQSLVSRVDVVTGGASAAYGSDAVVGAVNFVLDKTFTGIKGSVSTGISSRNDNGATEARLPLARPCSTAAGISKAALSTTTTRASKVSAIALTASTTSLAPGPAPPPTRATPLPTSGSAPPPTAAGSPQRARPPV